jgi:hypothetical protein
MAIDATRLLQEVGMAAAEAKLARGMQSRGEACHDVATSLML